jgi:hypothetical protein
MSQWKEVLRFACGAAGTIASMVALSACVENRRDAHCTPDEASIESSEDCIYSGLGKGPAVVEDDCPPVEGTVPANCPTFDDVLAVLVDPKRGDCSNVGCHGDASNPAVGIYLPADNASAFYESLTSTSASVGRLYVTPDDQGTDVNEALDSWIVCNLLGDPGGGFPMPVASGLPNPADAEVIKNWILCGAKKN